jgi:hypothetical protein
LFAGRRDDRGKAEDPGHNACKRLLRAALTPHTTDIFERSLAIPAAGVPYLDPAEPVEAAQRSEVRSQLPKECGSITPAMGCSDPDDDCKAQPNKKQIHDVTEPQQTLILAVRSLRVSWSL